MKVIKNIFFSECVIRINGDLTHPQPLILIPGTMQFKYPQTRNGIISVSVNEEVELFCSSSVSAKCYGNGQFLINETLQDFRDYRCNSLPAHIARFTGRLCYDNAIIIEIGFNLGDGRFLSIMEICHDPVIETNHYVYHNITPVNIAFQRGFPRPAFRPGGFFNGKNVNNLYTQNNQRLVFGQILGSNALASDLIQTSGNSFLARGHLAAKVDYIFGTQQHGTFYFVNAAPQWQNFNGFNWERVENGVRTMAADRNLYLDIYTGTYGIMTLLDINGIPREMFLDISGPHGQIPVPKIFYKVVIERTMNRGIVFIGVNNPHATLDEILASYIFCNDYSNLINWINWDIHSITRGYMYACDVNEFAQVVKHLPTEIFSSGLLF